MKQAPWAWYQRFSSFLHEIGFLGSKADTSLFIRRLRASLVIILVYVDDIILTGNDMTELESIIVSLNSEFAMTDLGTLHYFLGINGERLA